MALDVYKDWLGIPEGPRPPDHYVLLRLVQFEDAAEKIRGNYKKLNAHVRRYATGAYLEESQALLNELAKAMLCLTDLERKREYDASMGRVVEESAGGPKTMDVVLLEQKHISLAQAKEAKEHAERTGLELRDAFVQLKMVDPDLAAQALAQELGLPYVDLADLLPDDDVLDQVSRSTVKQNSILPLFNDEGVLLVACTHLIDHELEEELRLIFGVPVRPVLAAPKAINQAIAKYYAPGVREQSQAAAAERDADKPKKKADKKTGEKQAARPEKQKSKPRRGPLTAEEQKQQRMIGMIIICWSFVVAYGLDWYVISPGMVDWLVTPLLYTVIPGLAALFAWINYFQK